MPMNVALETFALTKRYHNVVALDGCALAVPAGRVVGLVGPNGAGKTTLMHLAVGLLVPTSGTIEVFGASPTKDPAGVLAHVGFLGQDRPLYGGFTVAEMMELGRRLNARWDHGFVTERLQRIGIPFDRKVKTLSGGQRAQVALTLALGKRPKLVLLDEPVSGLDPVARLEFLQELMSAVAEDASTVVLSSHVIADVERVCDHLVILAAGKVRLAGDIDALVAGHALVVGPRNDAAALDASVIEVTHADRQTTKLIRTARSEQPHVCADGSYVRPATLEEIVLAYLRRRADATKEAA
jgi:ABC-2 type transport system ATP-binding protein